MIEAAFVVQSDYAPECEARVLIHTFGKGAEFLVNATGPFGQLVTRPLGDDTKEGGLVGGQAEGTAIVVPIKPQEFIREILLGPRIPDAERGRLIEVITQHGLAEKIRHLDDAAQIS